ncbi:alpha-L-rhamnosidase [Saccharibacillus alkalitolerans]|uniref:alpha-L-rhamnosidase n=1 Tax=Saccharibacillus alkalitolerans TaxID=2705290 RepID=A0ABX0FAA0_9BACL|nr:alpha-L-rhamnosidase [Saccharibacillus alkalitolerans]NGZ76969.1 family 78 glycoside hydrolase catalytic domain [Saccharibacillus alkalitolerans]
MRAMMVTELRCEYLKNPMGLTVSRPRLGWKLLTDRRNALQTAYRIQVAAEDETFAEENLVWDSGRLESDESAHVEYAGEELKSVTRYVYRVRVWDDQGEESPWSDSAYWETGLLNAAEWRARWITPAADKVDPAAKEAFYLRREFETDGKKVRRATLLATALGLYELELDGRRVGDSLFTPGWTSYDHRLQVQAYDVTDRLAGAGEDRHVLGAALADGWYKGRLGWEGRSAIYGDRRGLLLQLHIRYDDGTEGIVATDESWRATANGPIRMSGIYEGETYDASFELPGWSERGFDDSGWHPAETLDRSMDTLIGEQSERVKVTETIRPVSVISTPAGETVLDLGQNMVGRMVFTVNMPAGTKLTLHHAEVLDREGNFYAGNLRTARQEVTYLCRGGGAETYRPSFTFQGFRYVRLTGFPEPIDPDDFAGEVIHTDMRPTGFFECSDPRINRLQRNIVWGQRGNFLDIPTDCPQRDERLGWTGDAQVFIRTAAFNYGVAPFFAKWLKDLAAEQLPSGGVPFVVPDILDEGSHSSAAWGDAAVICPWTIYQCYGDKRILEEQYGSMTGWVEYIRSQGDSELLWNTGFHFGDWLGLDAKENSYVGATPRDLICTAFFAYSTSLVAKTAAVLGREEDAAKYEELHGRIVRAFADEFITPSGRLAGHTQTSHVLALMFGLAEGETRKRLADTLAEYVRAEGMHLTTGFVGTPYLCHVLSENGHHDVAVQLVLQEEYPSWLYSVKQGATTIWEHWDGIKPDGSFWSDDMNSYNHYAYGAVGDWLYRALAGLDTDENEPGCKRIVLRPKPDSGLTHARAQYDSVYGKTVSGWSKTADGAVTYEFELPPNTTARVRLPDAANKKMRIDERDPAEVLAAPPTREEDGSVTFELGSGRYTVKVGEKRP